MNRITSIATACAIVAGVAACGAYLRLHHFSASELSAKAYPMRDIDLPPPSARNGVDYYGKLRMDVYIGADGVVERIDAGRSTVPQSFRDEAVKAFSEVRWEPGRKWGVKVPSIKIVEVDFEPPVRGIESPNVSPGAR